MNEINDIKIIKSVTDLRVQTPFSYEFLRRIKLCGAQYDAKDSSWILPVEAEKHVRELLTEVFGKDDRPAQLVTAHITVKRIYEVVRQGVEWWGRIIAQAETNRGPVRVGKKVIFVRGEPVAGGSRARWKTIIDDGCVIDVFDVPARAVFGRRYAGIEVEAYDKGGKLIELH